MSYRVGTPNYNLPQTEGTDKRDWSDTNGAFLAIDTAIKNAVDTSASASSAAATAQTTADGATTAATHAQTDATTAQTLATSASELATTAKNRADDAYTLANGKPSFSSDVCTLINIQSSQVIINKATKIGNLVAINIGVDAGNPAYASGWATIGTVPNGFRPSVPYVRDVVHDRSGTLLGAIRIKSDGTIEVYSNGIAVDAGLEINVVYNIE